MNVRVFIYFDLSIFEPISISGQDESLGEQSFGRKQQGVEIQSMFFALALDLNRFKGVLGRIPD